MVWRAFFLLALVVGVSAALTFWLGNEVLLALGLILTQLKVLAKKLVSVDIGDIWPWIKSETRLFFRVELFKKWIYTTAVPLLVGNAVLRRAKAFLKTYLSAVQLRYTRMMTWYQELPTLEKAVATLIVLFATLALAVSSLGLWLVLFTVQLPIWVIAALAALWKMTVVSFSKWAFKVAAFFQLSLVWKMLRGQLPTDFLEQQRRLNFRLARKVVRKRRLTVQQLASGKDSLALRWALMRARRSERTKPGQPRDGGME